MSLCSETAVREGQSRRSERERMWLLGLDLWRSEPLFPSAAVVETYLEATEPATRELLGVPALSYVRRRSRAFTRPDGHHLFFWQHPELVGTEQQPEGYALPKL